MHQAVLDGVEHPEIQQLASAGTSGQNPSHCNRDLLRWLGPQLDELPWIETVDIPMIDTKNNKKVTIQLPLQLPHDIFYFYSTTGKNEFNQLFGSPSEVVKFWEAKDVQDPAYVQHPAVMKPG